MVILRRGEALEEREYRYTCGQCRTYFSFLRRETHRIVDPLQGIAVGLCCPACNEPICIPETQLENYSAEQDDRFRRAEIDAASRR